MGAASRVSSYCAEQNMQASVKNACEKAHYVNMEELTPFTLYFYCKIPERLEKLEKISPSSGVTEQQRT
jgi:hypothetical protein